MSIYRMVERDAERHAAPGKPDRDVTVRTGPPPTDALRKLPDGLITGLVEPRPAAAAPATTEDADTAVANALDILGRYIPSEVVAIYIFGLSGLGIVTEEFGTLPVWPILFGLCLFLVLLFVFVNWRVIRRKKAGMPFPSWPLMAAVISFCVWAIAIPGNPIATTPATSMLAGFVALVSSHVLVSLERLMGMGKT
ncbi:hypothetical protein [Actibacterium sp. D379-3]